MKKIKLVITAPYFSTPNQRLDRVLSKLFKQYSRSCLKKLILLNQVYVNNVVENKPDRKILGGEKIFFYPIEKDIDPNNPENILLNIIYEDKDILVINKPAGLVVHPGPGNHKGTILNALLYHYENIKNLPRAGIVHRLDKHTSGLMIIAKTISSYNYLVDHLKQRKIIREYQGIVKGNMISGGTINAPIMRHCHKRVCMMVHPSGKKSITHYRIINRFKFHTHILVRLETGRTHQIRVHMLYIGYPLLGDKVYKGIYHKSHFTNEKYKYIKEIHDFSRQALHANYLSFYHPITRSLMNFHIPFPEDMINLFKYL